MDASQIDIAEVLAIAKKHHGESRPAEAEDCYRRVIAARAHHADALNGLALLKWQANQLEEALQLARRATQSNPTVWRYHHVHGLIAGASHRVDEAIGAFQAASTLCPESAEAWSGLAELLASARRPEEAVAAYQRAQALAPLTWTAANNVGVALTTLHRYEEALVALRYALRIAPHSGELWFNLGNALAAREASTEAISAYLEALKRQPGNWQAQLNLGNVFRARRELTAAVECYRGVIAIHPRQHDAYNNLGTALWSMGQVDEALLALNHAISLRPESSAAHNNRGNVLKDAGRMDAAIAAFRRAVELAPQDPDPHSNLLYSLYFHPDYDEAAILDEARSWARAHAPATEAFASPKRASTSRKLHIGYVSPDFRQHCQSLFTLPLLSHHDRNEFRIHCYADLPAPDATSRRLASLADGWRAIHGSSDVEVDAMIREDGIDILVDLTMHMSNGRPLLFARRPAPTQVAWLAYPGTTGLTAIDFRLTDPWLDPPGSDDGRYTERSIRLPSTFWCYDPGGDTPPVNGLPAIAAGYVTFGCLNNFCKVSDRSLALWAAIMCAVPDSRLLLLAPPGAHRGRVLDILGSGGIEARRVEFVPYQARDAYLATYQRIDLCLDTLPYNGHTTSLDAGWMGVPVLTRVGDTVVGRAGWSQLNNLGFPELASFDDAEFVRKAVALARDLDRLNALRQCLRDRMRSSALMDGAAFAASMETVYRRMASM